jgi:predicted TIM-barrel fold metal-dependent hydrolase
VQVVGAERVVIGTDYPMGMGDFESVKKVLALDVSAYEREQMLGGNAGAALRL